MMAHGARKNDEKSQSKDKDVIDTIVDKIHSKDPSFKIAAHALLSQYRDLFSRTLSVTPALLEPFICTPEQSHVGP